MRHGGFLTSISSPEQPSPALTHLRQVIALQQVQLDKSCESLRVGRELKDPVCVAVCRADRVDPLAVVGSKILLGYVCPWWNRQISGNCGRVYTLFITRLINPTCNLSKVVNRLCNGAVVKGVTVALRDEAQRLGQVRVSENLAGRGPAAWGEHERVTSGVTAIQVPWQSGFSLSPMIHQPQLTIH